MSELPSLSELRHELRTPVNHIVGYAEMLVEDLGDEDGARVALDTTLEAARNILSLINDTLTPKRTTITNDELKDFLASLRPAQQRIIEEMQRLMATPLGNDTAVRADLEKILAAAENLTAAVGADSRRPAQPVTSPVPDVAPPRAQPPTGSAHMLVVDDIAENRDVLGRRLEREGYRVTMAANGREALERVTADAFDLILLDVLMPEMDGYQVLVALKDDPVTRDIPVIMVSALDDLPSIVRCIEQGAEDYLPKPFDPVLLRARISAGLAKKWMRDAEKEYLHQVNEVIAAATAMEAGAYEPGALQHVSGRADELGRLARVFDSMAMQIQAREQRLREQVHALRAEIAAARGTDQELQPAADTDLETGQRFAGRYQIIATIGAGGMGKVYRATDEELGEDVAIKTLRPELVTDVTLVERFKSETRLARRITHRNVVRTHDFGEWGGVYYLTMEYVEGITVRDLIDQRGRLGVAPTLGIARQLVDSLMVAHDVGVIHRDIKPQNLLLDAEGVLKVMDFGVARLSERTSTLTEAGLILGTPSYMPPEQLMGEAVDGRCDLYAVGVVLYEYLTAQLPFEAQSTVSLVAKVLNQEAPTPAILNEDIPPAFAALILRLLAKKADERIQTAHELAEQLAGLG